MTSTYPYVPVKRDDGTGWIVRDDRDAGETVEAYANYIAAYNRARSLKANDERRRKEERG